MKCRIWLVRGLSRVFCEQSGRGFVASRGCVGILAREAARADAIAYTV
ncbi:MAG TPA: hypothetical protein VGJ92_10890 [Methanocella sp.]